MAGGQRYGVELRSAQAADAAEIARLLGLPPEEAAIRLETVRTRADAAVLVATGWPGLAGVVAVAWAPELAEDRPVARLTALAVDAEQRRNGIGRLLLKAAAQAARAAGCNTIRLVGGSPDIEAFAHASGFAPTGGAFTRPLRRRAED